MSAPNITTPVQAAAWDWALAAMNRHARAWAGPRRPAIPARVATLPADELTTLQLTVNRYGANGRDSLVIYRPTRGPFAELPVDLMRGPR